VFRGKIKKIQAQIKEIKKYLLFSSVFKNKQEVSDDKEM
jgi:hypothetical protein